MKSFILIANGPFWSPERIRTAIQGRHIVALDGAANHLLSLGIRPHVILGDFDSILPQTQDYWGMKDIRHPERSEGSPANQEILHYVQDDGCLSEDTRPYMGRDGVLIVPAKNQMLTDLVKGIRYCDQQQAQDISIICATGGRDDHHEANKLALQTEYRKNRLIVLYGEQQALRWAQNESILLKGKIGDYCGFIAQNGGYGDSVGLEYPCVKIPVSLCNRLTAPTATLTITGSALVIMPSLLKKD